MTQDDLPTTSNSATPTAGPSFLSPSTSKSSVSTADVTTAEGVGEGSGVGKDFGTERTVEPQVEGIAGPPSIHAMAQSGDTQGMERLLAEGKLDVNLRDSQNVTPLHWAAINAQLGTCQWLLDHEAEVDAIGGDLQATPLQWAARNGHLYIIHLLLKYSADPNISDSQGFNTLHLVTHSSVVMALLYMLHQPIAVDEKDTDGHTSLMWAAWQGDAISIDLLLTNGASVHATDNTLLTPLHWAAVKGSRACISRLLKAGADLQAKDENGKTPRMMAEELKASGPFIAGLQDAGYTPEGYPIRMMFNPKNTVRAILVGPTVFLGISFGAASYLPAYSGVPLAMAIFFGMHHFLTRVVLGSKGFGDTVSKSPYFASIIVASIWWVAYGWITRVITGAPGHALLQLFFGICLSTCAYSFYRAITTDPGYSKLLESDDELKAVIEDLTNTGRFNGTVFCISCMAKKPLRAKHCRLCNRCTGRFDHHCPWIWNCVGFNNHRQFLIFITTLVMGIVSFIVLTYFYYSEQNPPQDPPADTPYVTLCSITPSTCHSFNTDSFLFSITCWAALQLSWTVILVASQLWQVAKQMTTLEVSNLGRYGWMGGRGGSSLREQGGAMAKMTGGGGSASASLGAIGAGVGPSGGDEDGVLVPDGPIGGGSPIPSHSHRGHSHGLKAVLGLPLRLCAVCSGPLMQVLGLDRFTKGKAMKGIMDGSRGNAGNPFDLGWMLNCQDFWTRGKVLGVDYRQLYDIPLEGFKQSRINRLQMEREVQMDPTGKMGLPFSGREGGVKQPLLSGGGGGGGHEGDRD